MGANASAYEEDDETITVMKGVRLTENVINRMRGASASANTQSPPTIPVPSLPAQTTAPLLPLSAPGEPPPLPVEPAPVSPPPLVEPILSSLSAEPALQSAHPPSVEPKSTPSPPPPPPPPPLSVEPAPSAPPPTSVEPAPQPPHPPSEEPAPSPLCVETTPLSPPPSVEPTPQPPPPLSVEPAPSAPPRTSVEPAAAPPPTSVKSALPSPHPSLEPAPSSPSLSVEPNPPPPRLVEPAAPAFVEPMSPTPCPVVSEEGLCRTVTQEQELQKGLEQRMSLTELEVHQGVEQEKVQAQMQVEERFAEENLKQSILSDRAAAQDHRLRAHLYAHQLEQRIRELKKQDALYREQVAKLERRGKRFYSAITESYQKASREVSAKFRQNQINPVCADLQREILKCYRENTGHTLSCSKIASLYLQCVTEARQSKTRPGD